MSSIKGLPSLDVQQGLRGFVSALRYAHSDLPRPQRNNTMRNTAGDLMSRAVPRNFNIQSVYELIEDGFIRGATEAQLQQLPAEISRWIHGLYAKRDGAAKLDFDSEHVAEETDEAACDIAEAIVRRDRSGQALAMLERSYRQHEISCKRALEAARQFVTPGAA